MWLCRMLGPSISRHWVLEILSVLALPVADIWYTRHWRIWSLGTVQAKISCYTGYHILTIGPNTTCCLWEIIPWIHTETLHPIETNTTSPSAGGAYHTPLSSAFSHDSQHHGVLPVPHTTTSDGPRPPPPLQSPHNLQDESTPSPTIAFHLPKSPFWSVGGNT